MTAAQGAAWRNCPDHWLRLTPAALPRDAEPTLTLGPVGAAPEAFRDETRDGDRSEGIFN